MQNTRLCVVLVLACVVLTVHGLCFLDAECAGSPDPCTTTPKCVNGVCVSQCSQPGPNYCDSGAGTCNFSTQQCEYPQRLCVTSACFTSSGTCDRSLNNGAGGCPPETPVVCPSDGNICTQDTCNTFTNQCENTPYVPPVCVSSNACVNSGCDVQSGSCVYDPVVCPDDGNVCTLVGCRGGSCVVTEEFVIVSFPNNTIYDCVEEVLKSGNTADILLDSDNLIAAYASDEECVKIVQGADGSNGFYFDCTVDTVVTVTVPLVTDITSTTQTTLTVTNTELVLSPGTVPDDTTSTILFDAYPVDPSLNLDVKGCTSPDSTFCAELQGSWTGDSVTVQKEQDCLPYATSAIVGSLIYDSSCTAQKRSIAQSSSTTQLFNGVATVTFKMPATNGPVFYSSVYMALIADSPQAEDDCARSRCYWSENHATCTSVGVEAQFPSSICGIDAQTIFDADVSGDAWPMLAIETLTARDNCMCGGVQCTEKQLDLLLSSYELLEEDCGNTPIKPGKNNRFGKYVSTAARLREITRENLCPSETEEEYKFCTPSVRKVQKCKSMNQKRATPSLTCDCHLEPVTESGYGHYQYETASMMGEPLSTPNSPSMSGSNMSGPTIYVGLLLIGCLFW